MLWHILALNMRWHVLALNMREVVQGAVRLHTKQCIYIHTPNNVYTFIHIHTLSLFSFFFPSLSLSLTNTHIHAVVAEETVALFLEYARGSAKETYYHTKEIYSHTKETY